MIERVFRSHRTPTTSPIKSRAIDDDSRFRANYQILWFGDPIFARREKSMARAQRAALSRCNNIFATKEIISSIFEGASLIARAIIWLWELACFNKILNGSPGTTTQPPQFPINEAGSRIVHIRSPLPPPPSPRGTREEREANVRGKVSGCGQTRAATHVAGKQFRGGVQGERGGPFALPLNPREPALVRRS